MSQPFTLYRLQQIDSQLDQAHVRIAQIQKILSNNAALQEARLGAAATETALQETDKLLRRAEEEVQSQRIKIEQTEATLYGGRVSNPKELQDLQNESAALKRYLAVLEDRQLEVMMTLEDHESEHEQATAHLAKVEAEVAEQHKSLHTEHESLQKEVSRYESERQAAAAVVPEPDSQLYEQLRIQRRGIAVAKVVNNNCSACGSTLTPAIVQSARSSSQLTRCSFCGRILYSG